MKGKSELRINISDAIVTGGAKVRGKGIVEVLAYEGAIPVIVGRSESNNKQLVKEIEYADGQAFAVTTELSYWSA